MFLVIIKNGNTIYVFAVILATLLSNLIIFSF